jgi:hypothetical protein
MLLKLQRAGAIGYVSYSKSQEPASTTANAFKVVSQGSHV